MRYRSSLILLALAIVLGVAAAFLVQQRLERQTVVTVAMIDTVPVVVAAAEGELGSALRAADLEVVDWPKAHAPAGHHASKAEVEGRVLRRALAPGEPVLESALLPVGAEAGLASLIGDEKRAVSVKVDPVIGVAGFVTPGARVDVLATIRRVDQQKNLPYSKVILEDIPVLAIDQKLDDSRDGEPELVSVVTLEVRPDQAQKLIYSAHEGALQLALRNPADRKLVPAQAAGAREILAGPARPAAVRVARTDKVTVIKGTQVSVKNF